MGRKSLEATKLRLIWCARAAVTVFRECEWADADFFFAEPLDLCVLDEEDDAFFFGVDEGVLSCASTALPGAVNRKASVATRRRLEKFTELSLARLPHTAYGDSFTESVPPMSLSELCYRQPYARSVFDVA
jgi:hypothetical protein